MTPEKNNFIWQYAVPILVGLLLATFFPSTKYYQNPKDKKKYRMIQMLTLVAAIIGAKLAALAGDHFWPMHPLAHWQDLLSSGRSIMGGFLLGFLVAEFSKPIFKYKLPPNDRFAMILPFSVATGRIGCLLAGCCRGLPFNSRFAIAYSDGIARHPIPVYEILFHFSMGLLLIYLVKKQIFKARIFAFYLMVYAVFRALTESIRVTPKNYAGYSFYQWLALILFFTGLASFIWRSLQLKKDNLNRQAQDLYTEISPSLPAISSN